MKPLWTHCAKILSFVEHLALRADVTARPVRSELMPIDLPRYGSCEGAGKAWENSALYAGKNFCIYADKFAHIRREISVYAKINFCIYEKIFPHMRKFIAVRMETYRHIFSVSSVGMIAPFFAFLFPVKKTIPLKRSEEPPGG